MEVGVAKAMGRQGVDVRRGDLGAIATQIGETEVIEDDADHIGRAGRGPGRLRPVGTGLAGGQAQVVAAGRRTHAVSFAGGRFAKGLFRKAVACGGR